MHVIVSHPFAGAIYWWFARQMGYTGDQAEKAPRHPYYRQLYEDIDLNVHLALAFGVVFEQVTIPAVDAAIHRDAASALNLHIGSWDYWRRAVGIRDRAGSWFRNDPVIASELSSLPAKAQEQELTYAIVDVLMSAELGAPVICATGRRRVVRRLIELSVADSELRADEHQRQPDQGERDLATPLAEYVRAAGILFREDATVSRLGNLKADDKIRTYSSQFQKVLTGGDSGQLFSSIASAWESADLSKDIAGGFAAATRTLNVLGAIPIAGTPIALLGLGADLANVALDKRADRLRWYELGPEIMRLQSREALREELERRETV